MVYVLCLALFCVGVYGMLAKRNLIKIILGLFVAEYAVNMLFVVLAYRREGRSPIHDPAGAISPEAMVDPLPHALVLTSIVIGLAVTALLVALAMRLHEKFGTYDVSHIRELKG